MAVLVIILQVLSVLTALLALLYVIRDLAADLVLLGACALLLLVWLGEAAALGVRDLAGGQVPDPVLLYGYLLTAVLLPVAGLWVGVWERSRYGSAAILVVALTSIVLQVRVEQLWPGGFA
ncbi:hypothetical protein [Brachybacterium hainanense]|uniref:Integral membrane protein n=1 Tax=Brachybacterium hainanense TaxID=1541174 RepID=A0ABV6RCF4_9MICO